MPSEVGFGFAQRLSINGLRIQAIGTLWARSWREEPGGLQSMRLHRVGHD